MHNEFKFGIGKCGKEKEMLLEQSTCGIKLKRNEMMAGNGKE